MDKHEALDRLTEILEELNGLGSEVEQIIKEHFPQRLPAAQAYEIFSFGRSSNRYDSTLEKLVESLERSIDKEEDDDKED